MVISMIPVKHGAFLSFELTVIAYACVKEYQHYVRSR